MILLFSVAKISARTIENEYDFNQAYTKIIVAYHLTILEKEQAFIDLLSDIKPIENSLYTTLIAHKMRLLAEEQHDKDKSQYWRKSFNKSLVKIQSKQSLAALKQLNSINELISLQNSSQHIQVIKIAVNLLTAMYDSPVKKINIINDAIYIREEDIADTHRILGKSYHSTAEYEQAQISFLKSLVYYEKHQNLKEISGSYSNLSTIMWAKNDFEQALIYSDKTLKISQEIGDSEMYLISLSNQGIYYTALSQLESAMASFQKAINHPEIKHHPRLAINTMISLAETYITVFDLANAEKMAQQAYDSSKKINNKHDQAKAHVVLANIYHLQDKKQQAITLLKGSLAYFQQNKLQHGELNVYQLLSQIFQTQKNWQQAFIYTKKHEILQNKMNTEAQSISINNLQEKYETQKKQKHIDLLEAENKLNTLTIEASHHQRKLIIFFSILLIFIVFLAVSRFYSRRESVKLKQHNIEIKENEKQLLLLSNAFKNTADAVWITNQNFEIEVVNQAYAKQTQRKKSAMFGCKVTFAAVNDQQEDEAEKIRLYAEKNGTWKGELYDQKASGEIYPLELEVLAIKDDNKEIIHYLGVFRDITEKRKVQQQLIKLATHDELTGLPNRTLLNELILRSCLNSQNSSKSPAILLIDVNGFRKINDSYGHSIGDDVICAIAQRLSDALYSKDVIARINGAEFCVLAELVNPQHNAASVSRKILTCFEDVFTIKGHLFNINACIGITLYPDDGNAPQELLKKSALAMTEIKKKNQNAYRFFEKSMNNDVAEQLHQEELIINAIEDDLFYFHYQPLVDTKSGKITGAEALIRRKEINGSITYPDQFIPFAEKSGLIDKIDRVTINKTFAQVSIWRQKSINFGPVAINLSAKTFSQSSSLIALLKEKLIEYMIPPSAIKIEITEGTLLNNIEQAIKTMHKMKNLGFKLSLDDFGTGFSSLNYLKQFPIDVLKIDRSFIMDMHQSSIDLSIVRSIIDLAHNLNLSVVAEGVELTEHLTLLQALNCQEYQGYFYSRAISSDAFEQLLKTIN
ncbi:MAG: diguanylate cyclase (GGDEF)-like protein/PAS domain S-box-containing protein [Alteromonadaceae bacterium]|jgi:diguanylate cyclase (GGDEF)-like protein/PAS domain S-box-containing protein